MKILQIISSLNKENSYSSKLSNAIIEKLKEHNSNVTIVTRDLVNSSLPHYTDIHIKALTNSNDIDSKQKEDIIKLSDLIIDELLNADTVVIGVPMYNFAIPSHLKAWVDFLTRSGKTFRYTADGVIGLVGNKKVYLAISTGGIFSEGEMKTLDFTESYLKTVLGFIGITDVQTFRVEGVAIPGIKETAFEKALVSVASLDVSKEDII